MVKRQNEKPSARAVPRQQPVAKQPAAKRFTMRHLWRMTLWAATAACALLVAVMASRSEVGAERLAAEFPAAGHGTPVATPPFDAQAETRRLADALQNLAAENKRLQSRLAAIEQNMDDITGSITRQIAAIQAQPPNPWPADATPQPITPGNIGAIIAPSAGIEAPVPSPPQISPAPTQAPSAAPAEPAAAAAESPDPPAAPPPPTELRPLRPVEYGVDIGSAQSIQMLHARWLGVRSAHPQLFERLTPSVMLRQIPRSKRVELHLVAGPLPNSQAAARLCAELAPFRLSCHPTVLGPDRVALQ